MPVTFAQILTVVNRRCGPYASLADAGEAVAYALVTLGLPPASPLAVADSDLLAVTGPQVNQVIDVAEWRMIEAVANNATAEELGRAGSGADPDRVHAQLRQRSEKLASFVRSAYGVGLPSLQVGTVDFAFQQEDNPGTVSY